jgi:hypothetical protein
VSAWPEHDPIPCEVIVHERVKPVVPFGFGRGSGVKWEPSGPERHIRDKATVEWARRMREESK